MATLTQPDVQASLRPHATHATVISLDLAPSSEWVEVLDLPRGRSSSRCLGQLGICINERLRVVSTAPMGGPVLVDAGGTTVAIGRSLASRITVRLLRCP